MITDAQKEIIKNVCSIQFRSLEDIFQKPYLGKDEQGDSYEEILEDLGISRKDLDQHIIITHKNFKKVYEDPTKLMELSEFDLVIFKYILYNWEHKWIDKYPKALANLWNRLFLFTVNIGANDETNKN